MEIMKKMQNIKFFDKIISASNLVLHPDTTGIST